MGRAARIARRTFLIGSAAVAGGVAFGTYLVVRDPKNPLLDFVSEREAAITPYVILDATGVTLVTPRAELGQGATSLQAALLAEEMDLDWQSIRTVPGPPSPAYYNAVVAGEGLPIAATDDGYLARTGRAAGGALAKVLGLQITGGSSTVPDAFDKLRAAGAVAREVIVSAAAAETGLDRDTLHTEAGHVVLPDGTRLPYGALALAAARIPVPDEVALRDPSEWRLLGTEFTGLETRAKSTGQARFGIDFDLPGMLYAAIRQPPVQGSIATKIDDSAARAVRGVEDVVRLTSGIAVIATSTYPAMKAAKALRIIWSDVAGEDSSRTFGRLAAAITADARDSRFRDDGTLPDRAADMAQTYTVPYLAHAPLEPMSATAQFADGVLRIWTSTQVPLFLRDKAADLVGVAKDAVEVTVLPGGGSFGRRLELDYALQAAELATRTQGRPVKLTWTREEDMTHDFPRPAALAEARGWVADGRVQALDLAIAAPSTAASQMGRLGFPSAGPDVAIVAGAWDQPFAPPAIRVTGYRAPEAVGVSSWRSVGASANVFFHESALDELIHAAGADPLAERLRLCTHAPSIRVLEEVGALSDWGSSLPDGHGRGVAFCLSFGVSVAEVVEVATTARGIKLIRAFAVAELGRVLDPVNCENQMQGGLAWGLGHAMFAKLTYKDGVPQQTNFDSYRALRMPQCPDLVVRALETTDRIRGIGEPTVPPAAPALANAIFAATGQRIRALPLADHIAFA
ncbi:xanthine dehydrogenase family protein molybdopterin-binding subunit [Maribius pontilimi]|uniref:Xanthine dehydrogenase family protein molybdopterin-binding subunit n=1 Tax=Palleronia pontilimi TaxID=1964209 RepID=A0A934IHJ8_9RHOB|nr:molybdopterin cofactor-binding domain-containing protein [Palleronia pontilimi]MBJ3763495.1 xanthine dehydrogenase family protein molybdopterin-binding subunit [Palleronia pontilimi]